MSGFKAFPHILGVALVMGWAGAAGAQPLSLAPTAGPTASLFEQAMPSQAAPYEATEEELGAVETPAQFRRQIVSYATHEPAGTIIVDTPNTYLYYVLGNGRAVRYGIGVGREGFTWSGTKAVAQKKEWPDWVPPAEMIARQPYLPRFMAGGPGNPLGARALYIGGTVYRIHGTNQPSSIGKRVSSGCIRMLNADIIDLYSRANVGAKVVVLPDTRHHAPALADASGMRSQVN
jgi:lipoprotein-anchoring transpeptidase ErfK/SrfK